MKPSIIVTKEELIAALESANADQHEPGVFRCTETPISFLGAGTEFVINDSACYFKDGEPKNLFELLKSRGALQVMVI